MSKNKYVKTQNSGVEKEMQAVQFPKPFFDRMQNLLGDEFECFKQSLSKEKQSAIFVNNHKIETSKFKQIADFEIEPIFYEPNGFYVNTKLGKHPLHHAGAFYVQEPSAIFTVNAHKFVGDEKVLDMCAAPGGKSIQIANRIPNGVLVSNEINNSRCSILFSNIERMGLDNVVIANDTPQNIAEAYGNYFDVVLVDAPCSGEGMFRRGEQVVKEWNENLPKMCADRQLSILACADKTLKQNGTLIYSTCTYSVEENEQVVKQFCQEFDYSIVNIDCPIGSFGERLPRGVDLPQAVRMYPHKVRGEGQFIAVLKKNGQNKNLQNGNLKLKESSSANEFLRKNLSTQMGSCFEYGDFGYCVKDLSALKKGVNYYSIGVRVGQIVNKRFEPCHNLFTAFGRNFKNKLELNYPCNEILRYLKGETLTVEMDDGYGAVILSGCPVGGFKLANGQFKNHYPKGLRNQF